MNRHSVFFLALAALLLTGQRTAIAGVDTLWTRVYDPSGPGGTGYPTQLLADTSGAYVFGYYTANAQGDIVTVKYTNTAELAWAEHFHPREGVTHLRGAALHPSGGVVVCGEGLREGNGRYHDFDLVRYANDGTIEWQNTYCRDTFSLTALGMTVDPAGNTLVTGGYSSYLGPDDALFLAKVDPDGDEAWMQVWSPDTLKPEAGYMLTTDSAGYIYVGASVHQLHRNVACLLKFNSSGQLLWHQYFPSPDTETSTPEAVAVGRDGDVTMLVQARYGDPYMATCTWSASGAPRWVREFHSPDGRMSNSRALALDSAGNIHATGAVRLGPTNDDVVTVKYTPDGDTVFTALYVGEDYDDPYALALWSDGTFYVGGDGKDTLGEYRVMMLCFDAYGGLVGKHLLLPGTGAAPAVTVSPAGQVLAAAEIRPTPGAQKEIYLIGYTLTGEAHDVGCTRIVAPAGRVDTGLVVTPVCSLASYSTFDESYPVRLRIGGNYNETVQVENHHPGAHIEVRFPSWTVGPPGSYAVTCSTECADDPHPENDARRAVVTSTPPGIGEGGTVPGPVRPGRTILPRGGAARLGYSLGRASFVEASVLDAAGRTVCVLTHARQGAGAHELVWNRQDSSGRTVGQGVYYLRLAIDGRPAVRKLVLVE